MLPFILETIIRIYELNQLFYRHLLFSVSEFDNDEVSRLLRNAPRQRKVSVFKKVIQFINVENR